MKHYKHLKASGLLRITIVLLGLQACVSIAPVNSNFDSARVLKRGEIEFSGHFSEYYFKESTYKSIPMNQNAGFRFGLGLNDKIDAKMRYEYLLPDGYPASEGINYFSLIPKIQLSPGKVAFTIPLSVYNNPEEDNEWLISPGLIFTKRFNPHIELSYGSKADVVLTEEFSYLWGHQLGFGFSGNLDKWAVRPELGLMKNLKELDEGTYLTFGLGLTIILK